MLMPKGDAVMFYLSAGMSLCSLLAAWLSWWGCQSVAPRRAPRRTDGPWGLFYIGLGSGIRAASEYRPFPDGPHNPYAWAYALLLLVFLGRQVWHWRKSKTQQAASHDEAPEIGAAREARFYYDYGREERRPEP